MSSEDLWKCINCDCVNPYDKPVCLDCCIPREKAIILTPRLGELIDSLVKKIAAATGRNSAVRFDPIETSVFLEIYENQKEVYE